MVEKPHIRKLFLQLMCVVYTYAFASIFIQIPGLYGTDGILPVRVKLNLLDKTDEECFANQRTLVCFAEAFGLDSGFMMMLVALLGLLLSFIGFLFPRCCLTVPMGLLWFLYFSLYQIGQVFMMFQWDLLLLEAGFLAIIVAPMTPLTTYTTEPKDGITLWLVKWLLFRLMFASGVVKLTSGCPTWWGLTALEHHFESQCIPTPLSWFAHHLSTSILQLMVVGTYVIEIGLPLLFFLPFKSLQLFAFIANVGFQVAIALTGNYNFFNILTVVLCLSLLDNDCFIKKPKVTRSAIIRGLSIVSQVLILAISLLVTCSLFSLQWKNGTVLSKISFTREEFDKFVSRVVPASVFFAMFSLAARIAEALTVSLIDTKGLASKIYQTLVTCSYTGVAIILFGLSLVPFTVLDQTTNTSLWPSLHTLHASVDKYEITNSYGLFRRMTGVEGRPEVILEGSDSVDGPWQEYHFVNKPGNVSASPCFIFPHQPRLDWQMWFAALDSYNYNPWLVSLSYRILTHQPEVLVLLDQAKNPFSKRPPKYVRGSMYTYQFTPKEKRNAAEWWGRKRVGEYLPVFSKTHPPLLDYLKNNGILGKDDVPVYAPKFRDWLKWIHTKATSVDPPVLLWSLFTAGCAIIATIR